MLGSSRRSARIIQLRGKHTAVRISESPLTFAGVIQVWHPEKCWRHRKWSEELSNFQSQAMTRKGVRPEQRGAWSESSGPLARRPLPVPVTHKRHVNVIAQRKSRSRHSKANGQASRPTRLLHDSESHLLERESLSQAPLPSRLVATTSCATSAPNLPECSGFNELECLGSRPPTLAVKRLVAS